MRFGAVPVAAALGGIVAHSIRQGEFVLRKGTTVTASHMAELAQHGIAEIVVALMDASDLSENDAAGQLAQALAGQNVTVEPPATGRANLFSQVNGLLAIERDRIDAINAIDEAITVATLEPLKRVVPGEMIATVKIIPFAVEAGLLAQATAHAQAGLKVLPFRQKKVGVISTLLPGLKPSVVDKTLKVMSERLATLGCEAVAIDLRVPHETAPLAQALAKLMAQGCELAIVFGASAITDRRDVIPAAIEASGGRIEHLGMPVDPGNLLLIGEIGGVPVIGAPGCARSPKENGFDWVLQRLLADLPVRKSDIQAMGTGGLLMEIVSRPQPRATVGAAPDLPIAAVVLAAGRSTRMGSNKLLETLRGKALVRHVTEAALASRASPVIVVTGHQDVQVRAALAGLEVFFIHNPHFAEGMAGSL
ncbi:MAG: NTP transferase domain-containing protein, partial [Bosea sp. (in: a-proteobacteria)]